MDSPQLDMLALELHARLQRGDFRRLSPVPVDHGQVMEAELMTRIVLADIEHILEQDRTRRSYPTGETLRMVGMKAQRLLQLARDDDATLARSNVG